MATARYQYLTSICGKYLRAQQGSMINSSIIQYSRSRCRTNAHPLPEIWKYPLRCISRMAAKFSGFLSKKYSGGSPGTNSSQKDRIPWMVEDLISFPSLVVGYFSRAFLWAINRSPPTSRITHFKGSFSFSGVCPFRFFPKKNFPGTIHKPFKNCQFYNEGILIISRKMSF